MSVREAYEFFKAVPSLERKLKVLMDVGLDYIKLGQPATTLSGGEAQRIKLATELSKMTKGKTIYILDEPTTGLHFEDIRKLLEVLDRLVEKGNTVVIIEHNLDVIKTADHIIDIGPDGGDRGGTVVASGTPEEISDVEKSYTAVYIDRMLKGAGRKENKKTQKKKAKVVPVFNETMLEAAEEVSVIDYEEKPKKRGRKKKEELGK